MLQKILILAISLNIPHNYFDSLLKLSSDLYLAKFLDIILQQNRTHFFFSQPSIDNAHCIALGIISLVTSMIDDAHCCGVI